MRTGTVVCLAAAWLAVGCGNDDEKPKSSAFGGSDQGGSAGNGGASGSGAQGGSSGSSASGGSGNSGGSSGGSAGSAGTSTGGTGAASGAGGGGGASDASTEFTPQDECLLCEQLDCADKMKACDDNTECSAMVACVEQGCEYSASGVGCIKICIEATCTSSTSVQLYMDTLSCRFCNQACQTQCAGLCSNLNLNASSYTCNG
ncbi:MAG: hypothetical protein H6718_21785 [Polyangiaceae bacterium]|nr:hypothetical protein [Myxococcales bacterium]MCB9588053.1 hypothetical protein [Polyangiaceae bacterium]